MCTHPSSGRDPPGLSALGHDNCMGSASMGLRGWLQACPPEGTPLGAIRHPRSGVSFGLVGRWPPQVQMRRPSASLTLAPGTQPDGAGPPVLCHHRPETLICEQGLCVGISAGPHKLQPVPSWGNQVTNSGLLSQNRGQSGRPALRARLGPGLGRRWAPRPG